MGLNETKTYTLISPEMDSTFQYNRKKEVELLKPMSSDKSIIRQTLIPSLLNVANYNFARNTKDVNIYEIANTYTDIDQEDTKVAVLMTGNYIENTWQGIRIKSDFYILKGIITNLLNYLGYQGRRLMIILNQVINRLRFYLSLLNIIISLNISKIEVNTEAT